MNTTQNFKNSTKNSNAASTESAQDRALNRFAEMMIQKIESIQNDWHKPWFTDGAMQWPRNLSGRHYNGMNSMMLLMHCENEGYKYPVFCTFDRVSGLNFTRTKDGVKPATDEKGNRLPSVNVRKGEKSFPVFLTTFTVINAEDGSKIKYDDYKAMSDDQRQQYKVFPKLTVYNVFNIEQTNMKEARPEMYNKLVADLEGPKPSASVEKFRFAPLDKMIADNLWICPITPKHGDDAYYSISKNTIVIPEFEQFVSGESFASNTFHEMAHSTGAELHLNRLKPTAFGSSEYAREELVAELTAALVAQYYGMDKHIKDDSAAYLKSWLGSLHESPDFLKTVLTDVKRCSSMLTQRIEAIQLEMDKGEKADFSQLKAGIANAQTNQQEASPVQEQAAKQLEEEQQHYHRSR